MRFSSGNKIVNIEIGQFAALCFLISAVLKLIDWLMPCETKRALGKDVKQRLDGQDRSFVFVAKTPVIALNKILTAANSDPVVKKRSWKRISWISVFLLSACLFSAGLATETILGFEQNPNDSYRQEIEIFERIISEESDVEDLTVSEKQKILQFREDVSRILDTAKHPFARWVSLALVSIVLGLASIILTSISLHFTSKITAEITTTDSPILIVGAILLNGLFSLLMFALGVVVLSIVSSALLIFAFSLVGILFKLGPLWGTASFMGYGIFAWVTAPVWLKALASASLVPFLVMIIAILLSVIAKPIINPFSIVLTKMLRRSVSYQDGVIAFFAVGFFCLASAILAATNMVS